MGDSIREIKKMPTARRVINIAKNSPPPSAFSFFAEILTKCIPQNPMPKISAQDAQTRSCSIGPSCAEDISRQANEASTSRHCGRGDYTSQVKNQARDDEKDIAAHYKKEPQDAREGLASIELSKARDDEAQNRGDARVRRTLGCRERGLKIYGMAA